MITQSKNDKKRQILTKSCKKTKKCKIKLDIKKKL